MALAQHSAATPEWGTSLDILDMGREVVGGEFDLDPSSSAYWNRNVRAKRFIDVVENGLIADWGTFPGQRINCNPAGGIVHGMWRRCCEANQRGAAVWWVGFSLEQIVYLQALGFFSPSFKRAIPPTRLAFLKGAGESPQKSLFGDVEPDAPKLGEDPTHGNYLVLMPAAGQAGREQVDRFHDVMARAYGDRVEVF